MGVIGGNTTSGSFFASRLRTGSLAPNAPGSSAPLAGHVNSGILSAGLFDTYGLVEANGINETTSLLTPPTDSHSYYNLVLNPQNTGQNSLLQDTGINPNFSTGGTVLREDLWSDTDGANNNQFSYLGFFTLDSGNQTLTFTPSAIPEPGAWQILMGAGLLAFWLRSQFMARRI